MMMEAEGGVRLPGTTPLLGPPATPRGWDTGLEQVLPLSPHREPTLPTPRFETSGLHTQREYTPLVRSLQVVVVTAAQGP